MKTIQYTVSYSNPHRQYIDFEAIFPVNGNQLTLQLPAWRPGRYELGNFAKNIQQWQATDANGNLLRANKVSKDSWTIEGIETDHVVIKYNYYSAELNAGSTWLDENQLYINPVNCFLYDPSNVDVPYEVRLNIPADYEIACGLPETTKHVLLAQDMQQMMDCPFIASASLWHRTYEVQGVTYHIWIQGRHALSEQKLLQEFEAFTISQVNRFGSIPCEDYHFIFQFPDQYARHGVEHENSTVIALGPAERLQTNSGYEELLGISCHELYHTWNIKSIRPKEMMPYDFSKENYSKLGYVAEGVTTYYGDLFLKRSDVFSTREYLLTLEDQIKRHLHNAGRFNLSVADSSFDTWLDGYSLGIPHRKVSIYTEGCLCAFITDVAIMEATKGEKSLDDAMVLMNERFGKKGIGYTEKDYRTAVEECAGKALSWIFDDLIYGVEDYQPHIERALGLVGIEISYKTRNSFTQLTGAQVIAKDGKVTVHSVWPNSPAETSGMSKGDEIVFVNGIQADDFLQAHMSMETFSKAELTVLRNRQQHVITIENDGGSYFPQPVLNPMNSTPFQDKWWSK